MKNMNSHAIKDMFGQFILVMFNSEVFLPIITRVVLRVCGPRCTRKRVDTHPFQTFVQINNDDWLPYDFHFQKYILSYTYI